MMSKKKQKELILTYKESRYFADLDGERDDREEEYVEWSPLGVFVDEPKKKAREKTPNWEVEQLHYDGIVKPGDTIWLLVVRYRTGGTFSSTSGAWNIEGVFKDESEARKNACLIEEDDAAYRNWLLTHPSYKRKAKDKPPDDKYKPKGYKCWQGHFESLESVEIHNFTVG